MGFLTYTTFCNWIDDTAFLRFKICLDLECFYKFKNSLRLFKLLRELIVYNYSCTEKFNYKCFSVDLTLANNNLAFFIFNIA